MWVRVVYGEARQCHAWQSVVGGTLPIARHACHSVRVCGAKSYILWFVEADEDELARVVRASKRSKGIRERSKDNNTEVRIDDALDGVTVQIQTQKGARA